MNKIIFFFLFIINVECFAQEDNYIFVKYIPFSTETPVNLSQVDINTLLSKERVVQVKNEIIAEDSIFKLISEKIKGMQKCSVNKKKQFYDLRMQCKLIENKQVIDSFYIDNSKMLVYKGVLYKNRKDIVDIIFISLCRPIFSYVFIKEAKYWPDNMECCFDSTEFKTIYGTDLYVKYLSFGNLP